MSTSFAYAGSSVKPLPMRVAAHHQDALLYVDRQANHIQRNLQVLIDAQSEGLLAGLSGGQTESTASDGGGRASSVSGRESSSRQGRVTVPVRQPAGKKIGLRAAREGIFKSMYNLLKLREEERELLNTRDGERNDALVEIGELGSKRTGLLETISSISNNRDSERTTVLKDEARSLESEIRELESRLYEMKAKHQHVVREISEVENSVESKLSSYRGSLSLLESNIRNYLQNPPFQPLSTTDEPTFYSLNPKRRTLDMAREHWKAEQDRIQKRQSEIGLEIQALEAGGGVWKQVMTEIAGFEKRLRAEMRRSIQTQSQILNHDEPAGNKDGGDQTKTVLDGLQSTTDRVERQLKLAEEHDWKLLVCCIGAELEALREAREMLLDAFHNSEEEVSRPNKDKQPKQDDNDHNEGHDHSPIDPLEIDNPEPPEDLLRDTREPSHDADTDDEPDPAWLLPES